MNKEFALWSFIEKYLKKGEIIALLIVAESSGSSPGRQGFKMAVSIGGEYLGSIGGGIMEVKLVELAKSRLQKAQHTAIVKKQIHSKTASCDQSGMICSGAQTVIIHFLQKEDLQVVKILLKNLKKHQSTIVSISQSADYHIFSVNKNTINTPVFQYSFLGKNLFELTFSTGFRQHLYIVGGGHCALALSEVMSKLDFYICLFDDRPALTTVTKNRFVHDKHLLQHYDEIDNYIPSGSNIYIVVMTLGYRSDEMVIRKLLKKEFTYLGLLGSHFKINTLMRTLEQEGYPKERLNSIYAPIGIDIHSKTPEEIAISIAAQLIAVKNK